MAEKFPIFLSNTIELPHLDVNSVNIFKAMSDTENITQEPQEGVEVKSELIEPESSAKNIENIADDLNNININENNTENAEKEDLIEKESDGPNNSTTPEDSTPVSHRTYEDMVLENKIEPEPVLQPQTTQENKSVVDSSPRDSGNIFERLEYLIINRTFICMSADCN